MNDLFNTPRQLPSSPKLMSVKEVGVIYAMQKNQDWHSRLPRTIHGNLVGNKHHVFYGAEYMDHCFAVAIWTTPVARKLAEQGNFLELRRLAIAPDAPKFTATWMLGKMVKLIKKKFPEIEKLYSYQDTEVHSGTIYAAANWVIDKQTKGGEWSVPSRPRPKAQSAADKIRWTYNLRAA